MIQKITIRTDEQIRESSKAKKHEQGVIIYAISENEARKKAHQTYPSSDAFDIDVVNKIPTHS